MKLSAVILCFSVLALYGCDSEEPPYTPETPTKPYHEQPHSYFLGLKGNIRQIEESTYISIDGEWETSGICLTQFTADGNISFYDPTGLSLENGIYKQANKRWIGVEMNQFGYEYAPNGNMSKATITSVGGEVNTYLLSYGTHSRYIPLPFQVGNMDFTVVKGLTAVQSDQSGFTCDIQDTYVKYTLVTNVRRDTWLTETTYSYNEGAVLPASCTVTETSEREGEVSREHTAYTFSEDGRLTASQTERYEYGTLIETENRQYHPTLAHKVTQREIVHSNGDCSTWEYRYEEHGWQSSITRTDADDTYTELYLYPRIDAHGNWYEGHFTWNEHVNLNHSNDDIKTLRALEYY